MAVVDMVVLSCGFWVTLKGISVWSLRGDDIRVSGDGSERVAGLKGVWMIFVCSIDSFVVVCLGILPDMFDIIWSNLFFATGNGVTDDAKGFGHDDFGFRIGSPMGNRGKWKME